MKVIKEKSREYNGKPYYKYKINLPANIVREAKLTEKDNLDIKIKGKEIIITKAEKNKEN